MRASKVRRGKDLRRQLVIDVDKIHVSFAGDAGVNCGEMISRAKIYGKGQWGWKTTWYSKWHDVCSGEDIILSDAEGRIVEANSLPSQLDINLAGFEKDSCSIWEADCCDLGDAAQTLMYDVGGGPKYYVFKISTAPESYPELVWEGTVKTSFVKW